MTVRFLSFTEFAVCPELVEGRAFCFPPKGRTVLRQAQDERPWGNIGFMSEVAAYQPSAKDIRMVIAASSAGTIFEWYDFFIYGTLAAIIGARKSVVEGKSVQYV